MPLATRWMKIEVSSGSSPGTSYEKKTPFLCVSLPFVCPNPVWVDRRFLRRKQLSSGERGVSLTNIPAEEELLAVDLVHHQIVPTGGNGTVAVVDINGVV